MTHLALWAGILLANFVVLTPAWAEPSSLPEPLTLEYALSLADEPHPALLRAEAQHAQAEARVDEQSAQNGLTAGIDLTARWLEPPAPLATVGQQDHHAKLYARKRLFDSGRTPHLTQAAKAQADALAQNVIETRAQRRLEIMERYFDVLLADLEYAHHNENMATAFIRYDRTRERRDVGQHSDFDVAKTLSESQDVRAKRYAAQFNQRATRARLAIALNHPGQLSQKLTTPKSLALPGANLADVEEWQHQAAAHNPSLIALRAQLQAANERRGAARAQYFPTVDAEAEFGTYTRDIGANDHWRAGVSLNIPLYQGGRTGAQVDIAQADVQRAQAELLERERAVAEAVLETWLQLSEWKFEKDKTQAQLDYRLTYLDRARTQYEQEVTADLGDAMVELTAAEWRKAQAQYRVALLWARLQALTGQTNIPGNAP